MIRPFVAVIALCLWPGLVLAQDGLGLDLSSEDPPKKEEGQQEELPAEAPAPSAEDAAAAAAASTAAEATPPPAPPGTAEREITQDDRVKSVQRKVYLKKNRFEVAPFVGLSVNDPYYSKMTASVKGSYYLADTLAIAARVGLFQVLPTEDVRIAKRTFQSRIFYSVPNWSAMGDIEWSPLYGKVAFLNSILHFDAYLIGGLGVVSTDTSALPGRGPNIAADLGVGLRFVAKDYLAVNVALINTSYVDQPAGTSKGSTQNIMTINAGISLFLPLRSTGRDAE